MPIGGIMTSDDGPLLDGQRIGPAAKTDAAKWFDLKPEEATNGGIFF
jgi:hypothetical protein